MEGFHLPHRQSPLREGRTLPKSIFFVKLYQPEKEPTVGQVSDKDVQCFLCLVVSTLNSPKKK